MLGAGNPQRHSIRQEPAVAPHDIESEKIHRQQVIAGQKTDQRGVVSLPIDAAPVRRTGAG